MRSVILGLSPSEIMLRNRRSACSPDDRCGDDRSGDMASRFAGLSGWFAGGSREERTGLSGLSLPSLGAGEPDPHARQEVDASSVTPADGKPAETKKARYVVALSRVLRSVRDLPRRFALGLVRPQARANLGSAVGRAKRFHNQERFGVGVKINWEGPRPSRLRFAGHLRMRAGDALASAPHPRSWPKAGLEGSRPQRQPPSPIGKAAATRQEWARTWEWERR